jgi:IS1 family transposase
MDEMWHYVQKKNKRWLWIAICRTTKRIVGFVIGCRGKKMGKKLWQQTKPIACQAYCRDYWQAYTSFIPKDKHRVSKKETYTIEGYNNLIRH